MAAKPDPLARLVGQRIRELRQEREWNQIDLEARLEGAISQGALSHYETGRYLPSLRSLVQIADAFGVPAAALLLDPQKDERHRAAAAVLTTTKTLATRVLALLGFK